jgi:2-iminobutanoate/2-iminopropanoate deaminase
VQVHTDPRREEIWVAAQGPPISHFTHAKRFGDLLFVSGCAPLDADNHLVGGDDAAAQTRQVLTNIEQILGAAGMRVEIDAIAGRTV